MDVIYLSLRMIKFHTQSSAFVYRQNNEYELVVFDIYMRILDRYIMRWTPILKLQNVKYAKEKILKSKVSKAVKIICYFL